MIEVRGLVRRYADESAPGGWKTAVNDVSFTAEPGQVFGLLGPNGAGKTTTLRILVTLLRPDAGTATLAGYDVVKDPEQARAHVGYLSSNTGLYARLTAEEMLTHFARLQGMTAPRARVDELIARFDIGPFARVRCERLSTGQRQRVSIARALVHDPPVLILDEPTAGLDILAASALLDFIREARGQGRTVLFSTHVLREAERLCDRIAILHQGRLLANGSLAELRASTGAVELDDVFMKLVEEAGP